MKVQNSVCLTVIFLKWIKTIPMAFEEYSETLDKFDMVDYSVKDLVSLVRKYGPNPYDKVFERMEQISEEIEQRDLENNSQREEMMNQLLKVLEQEKKEALSLKDQEINKLRKEKKTLEEALNRKRTILDGSLNHRITKIAKK